MQTPLSIRIGAGLSVALAACLPLASRAISFLPSGVSTTDIALGTKSAPLVVVSIINWSLGLLGLIAVTLILYAGFRWMTASGNEDNIEKAKEILLAAIVGLALILAAFGIAQYVFIVLANATNTTVV